MGVSPRMSSRGVGARLSLLGMGENRCRLPRDAISFPPSTGRDGRGGGTDGCVESERVDRQSLFRREPDKTKSKNFGGSRMSLTNILNKTAVNKELQAPERFTGRDQAYSNRDQLDENDCGADG
jgi:hypothetical protein